ncbi:DPP IV N-terminal domain-containing protein [Gramella jeungdoensis]|uniref:DPP IV N-terminal domain-containing protein n=1 Tax=Gramella jeungdoensis TaxID=708091 RepID=A0ABT0Z2N3_9FLAO|nr:DPP IV N-terminal domain-containing protein [Gramella jeungdoensis]MCM8569990.1 DPP IV N-terminal domain-containing protein [Gramella jeungdoensis]
MKKSLQFFFISLLMAVAVYPQTDRDSVTAKDYEHATKFLSFNTSSLVDRSYVSAQWLENGSFWYDVSTENGEEFILVNPKNGRKQKASSEKELLSGIEAHENDGEKNYTRNEILSPDGKKVAFIKDWNLWMRNLETGEETQLTTDGEKNFGYATDNAGWRKSDKAIILWSPDSEKIATYQQDQRHVSDMYLASTKVGAPELQEWKYPLPTDEEIIKIHRVIIEVDDPKVIRLDMPADPRRGTLCDDISCSGAFDDNQWNEDATKLAFVSTSRDHKSAKMRIADAETGEVRDIFEEKVETQYESGQGSINWRYLPESEEIIWYSERDDWGHLYLYDSETGKLKNQITKGDFVVTELLRVDEDKRKLYFLANGREEGRDPYFNHFYSVDFDGKNLKLLTPENGNHKISISPDGQYFVDNYSQPDVPNVAQLRTIEGKLVTTLEKADISRLKEAGWKAPKPISVKSRDGKWDLYGLLFTPTHLDENKKYPVVNYVYPGPQGGGVGSRSFYPSRRDHQALAELGFVVVVIDGTCNPDRSKSFHDACYGNMADNTLEDQISGIKQLAEKYPYMDLDHVGIWGHSGGGFATAAAMFKYPEFYKVGISESGNHDNRNYEDDWGERYIGLLTKDADGVSNYEKQANQNLAENLQGKLLLAHGAMDDNVPPYNTYLVVDALIEANKDFDLIIFPHARHGYGKDYYYMMRRRWDYFVEHLMGATPPENFEIEPYKKD